MVTNEVAQNNMHPLPDLPEGVCHGHTDLVKGNIRRARSCRV